MSKDGELRRSVHQTAAQETQRNTGEVESDSAHRSDAARRASLVGLRRVTAPRLANSSVDERREQIIAVRETGNDATSAALRLAAKQLDMAAVTIKETVKAPPDAAGMDRQLRIIEQAFGRACDTVHRLSLELSVSIESRLPEGQEFERNLHIFERAYTHLYSAVLAAKAYAARDPHQPVVLEIEVMKSEVDEMFRARRTTPADLAVKVAQVVGPRASDPRTEPVDQLRGQAIAANTEAVQHTARMIRMRMTTVDDEELARNASLLVLQLQELAADLEPTDRKAMKPHAAALQKAIQEVVQLREEIPGRPLLVPRLGNGTPFAETLRQVQQKAQRR